MRKLLVVCCLAWSACDGSTLSVERSSELVSDCLTFATESEAEGVFTIREISYCQVQKAQHFLCQVGSFDELGAAIAGVVVTRIFTLPVAETQEQSPFGEAQFFLSSGTLGIRCTGIVPSELEEIETCLESDELVCPALLEAVENLEGRSAFPVFFNRAF